MAKYTNDARQIKYEVLKKVAHLAFDDTLGENIDNIPYEIVPGVNPRFRCCVYKEREIVRQRVRLAMGKEPSNSTPTDTLVKVMDSACEGCPINRFSVTENCQKCMAKSCMSSCPFGAISMTGRGAYIDQEKCRECGRCAKACPYNAIADLVRPCKKSCPVDAISMDSNKIASIKSDKCIGCGACTTGCPFGAISDISSITQIIKEIKDKKPVYAMFAPALEGQFGDKVSVGMLKGAITALGFKQVYEVATGAEAVAYNEAIELIENKKNGMKMTTSCCPAFVSMIEKHFPKLVNNISSTFSPMAATARYIRKADPKAVVVFIGPCIAKKGEALNGHDTADYVLTFEELLAMFDAKDINVENFESYSSDAGIYGRQFAQNGGVSGSVAKAVNELGFIDPIGMAACSGAAECKKMLAMLNAGKIPDDIIEGMACEGGCIAGPATISSAQNTKRARDKLLKTADDGDIEKHLEKLNFSGIDVHRY